MSSFSTGPRLCSPPRFSRSSSPSTVALYLLGRRTGSPTVHELTWILAASQLISLIVPLLWEVVKFLAILVLVLLALFFLAILLLDRPGRG